MGNVEAIQQPVIDKSAWGPGPWQEEPDRVDFVHAGFACMALRHDTSGNWCGYVGVPREHPCYGKPYDDVDVDVHGGLTYSSQCSGYICHVPQAGMPDDVWWLGFDAGHAGDEAPGINATLRNLGCPTRHREDWETYRDLAYIRQEIERLAEQLAALRMP